MNSEKVKSVRKNKGQGNYDQQGGGSDWSQSFYAYFMSPAELSRYTLKHIDQAPMFNPLEFGTVMPTGTSGITPTGIYLANHPSEQINSKDYNIKSSVCAGVMGGGSVGAKLPGTQQKAQNIIMPSMLHHQPNL